MHPRVVKELLAEIVNPFYLIFKISLKTEKVPSAWKLGSISAIYKNKGSKNSVENYRPISLSSIACKILESIIRDSLMKYLMSNNILKNKQFGFMRGRSTILQLLKVVDKLSEILDRGGAVDVIYCDFMKAFDTVPHQRLTELLIHYGIGDPILSWIKGFLSNRKQRVIVNGSKSKVFDVISGVPQGSVLGPILFNIFINSLVDKAGTANLFLYADDLKIFKEISSEEDAESLQEDLYKLYNWTQYSLLRLHPDKCVVMRYTMNAKNTEIKPC